MMTAMGHIHTEIQLANPRYPDLQPIDAKARVDTGAATICLPEHIAIQLELEEIERREVTTADGKHHSVPYVGPLQIKFQNRTCFTGALVLGDSVLFGVIPMEDMDLIIDPLRQRVSVNPANPNIPCVLAKRIQG